MLWRITRASGGLRTVDIHSCSLHYSVASCCVGLYCTPCSHARREYAVGSHRPHRSGGFLWRWDPSSPTTFSPCRRTHPLPDARCVFRRETEVLSKATPSLGRLLCQARQLNGPPSPTPRPRRDAVPQNRLDPFEDGPLRYDPPCKDAPQGKE